MIKINYNAIISNIKNNIGIHTQYMVIVTYNCDVSNEYNNDDDIQ